MSTESKVKALVVYPQNGLANRLRVLASASILAEHTGRKLFVNWIPSTICNVEWGELFLNQIQSHPLPLSSFRTGISLYDDTLIPRSWYSDIPRLSIPGESDIVAVYTCRSFQPEKTTNGTYEEAKALFYRNLRPAGTVQKAVDDMQRQYFSGHMVIGVHIRRKDHLTFLKKDHRLVCPTRMFVEAMKEILHANPVTKFFLATDDKREEEHIRQMFPGTVIVYEKERCRRDTSRGMQEALVDWLLLSKTSRIIASYASSFSEEAGMVHRIKTDVIVHKEELSKNPSRPYLPTLLNTHYRILKEEGLKQYLLYSYHYRKNQIGNRIKRKMTEHEND